MTVTTTTSPQVQTLEKTVGGRKVTLTPESGCRMGICFSCTRRKTSGAVRNVITGAVSSVEEEDVQICVSAPVGDVDISL